MAFSEILHKTGHYNLSDIRFLTSNFEAEFNRILSNNHSEAVSLVEDYISRFPHQRHLARTISHFFRDDIGSASHYKRLSKAFIDLTEEITMVGRSVYGVPPVFENTYSMQRVGEMVSQTAMARHAMRLGLLDTKPILPLQNVEFLANKGFFPYLSDTFEIVSQDRELEFFDQIRKLVPYFGQLMKLTDENYGAHDEIIYPTHKLLQKMGKAHFAFKLADETIDIAEKYLRSYDLDLKNPFVTLHLREAGYVDDPHHEWRNVNVRNYIPAVEWLLNQGIQVVRIGHKKMTPITARKGIIDLTQLERPGEVDIYLCAKNVFFYGSTSGPSSIAIEFGAPTLFTAVNVFNVYQNVLSQIQPMQRVEGEDIVRLRDIQKSELRLSFGPKAFSRFGLRPKEIPPTEHLRSVEEMLEFLSNGKIIKKNHDFKAEKLQANFHCDTYLTSDSLSLL